MSIKEPANIMKKRK